MNVQTAELYIEHIDEMLARYDRELIDPALGQLVFTAAQIRINPYAEAHTSQRNMHELGNAYKVPEVCRAYNLLDAETQRVVTTRLLNGLSPRNPAQALAYESVQNLLAATLRPTGMGRVTLAFEGEWRERGWEILYADEDYRKVRQQAFDALDEETRRRAAWSRNLTALNIMAAISAGRYYQAPTEQ